VKYGVGAMLVVTSAAFALVLLYSHRRVLEGTADPASSACIEQPAHDKPVQTTVEDRSITAQLVSLQRLLLGINVYTKRHGVPPPLEGWWTTMQRDRSYDDFLTSPLRVEGGRVLDCYGTEVRFRVVVQRRGDGARSFTLILHEAGPDRVFDAPSEDLLGEYSVDDLCVHRECNCP